MNYYEEEEQYLGSEIQNHVLIPKKYTTKRADRFIDLNEIMLVIVYSGNDMIKLMPIKNKSKIQVYEKQEFKNLISEFKIQPVITPTPNRQNISEYLLEYQLNILGRTSSETSSKSNWKNIWKLSYKQKESFKEFALSTFKKVFKFNKIKSIETYKFFDEKFGLRNK